MNDLSSFEPPVFSTGKKGGRNYMEKFTPLKLKPMSGNTEQSAFIVIMKPQTWFIDK